jgi:hypothetical protein
MSRATPSPSGSAAEPPPRGEGPLVFDEVLREGLGRIQERRKVLGKRLVDRAAKPDGYDREPIPAPAAGPVGGAGHQPGEAATADADTTRRVREQREAALETHLAGLALSGGGIRSGTFAIGFFQGLARLRLLNWFDYLSTVSGGGYAGGWLVAWLYREGNPLNVEQQLDPSRIEQAEAERRVPPEAERSADLPPARPGGGGGWEAIPRRMVLDEEPEPIRHVRAYSSYLSPRGGLFSGDSWALLAIYLRNVLINLLVLLPIAFLAVLAVRGVVLAFVTAEWADGVTAAATAARYNRPLAGLCGVGVLLGVAATLSSGREVWRMRSRPPRSELTPRALFLRVVLPMLAATILVAIAYEHGLAWTREAAAPWMLEHFPSIAGFVAWVRGVTSSLVGGGSRPVDQSIRDATYFSWPNLLLHAAFFGLPLFVYSSYAAYRRRKERELASARPGRGFKEPFAALCGGVTAGLLVATVEGLLRFTEDQPWLRATIGPPLLLAAMATGFTVLVALLGARADEQEREWWGWLAGQLLRIAVAWLLLVGLVVYGPAVVVGAHAVVGVLLAAAWAAITGAGVRAGHSARTGDARGGSKLDALVAVAPPVFLAGLVTLLALAALVAVDGAVAETPGAFAEAVSHGQAPGDRPAYAGEAAGPAADSASASAARSAARFAGSAWNALLVLWFTPGLPLLAWALGTAAVGSIFAYLVDVNLFSLHALYANRLTRCFLGASRPKREWRRRWLQGDRRSIAGAPTRACGHVRVANELTAFDAADDVDLVSLVVGGMRPDQKVDGLAPAGDDPGTCYWGPYPIFNAAMNLVAGSDLAWRDRLAEAFCLTPLYCGSKTTGFARVTERTRGSLTLGKAIAISGAAVDPNMSYHQSPPMAALLTLFNARLGAWIRNPSKADKGKPDGREQPEWYGEGPGPGFFLVRELLGKTDNLGKYVHISDGGHFENLGVYELLRRRVRYVVAVDTTESPNATSGNLGNLVRLARVDLGLRIVVNTERLDMTGPDGRSRGHVAIGQIRYDDVHPEHTPGILVYVRASATGDEPADVRQYGDEHREFPRQSTADQFFDEAQFESYRALGEHVALQVFADAAEQLDEWLRTTSERGGAGDEQEVFRRAHAKLFAALRNRWLDAPAGDAASFEGSVRAWAELHRDLRDKDALAALGKELYPELADDAQVTAEERVVLHTLEQILQLIEGAWLGMGLDARGDQEIGRGWMNSLRRLTSAESFRRFWPLLRTSYSPDFQRFCERTLRLDAEPPALVPLTPAAPAPAPDPVVARLLDGHVPADSLQVRAMGAEFAREWPDLVRGLAGRALDETLDRLGPAALEVAVAKAQALRPHFPPGLQEHFGHAPAHAPAWLIVQRPRALVPAQEPGKDFLVGFLIIHPAADVNDGYDLLYWVRPAHRAVGIGEEVILSEPIRRLPAWLDAHRAAEGEGRRGRLRVTYPATPGGDGGNRNRWLNFFALYDFKPTDSYRPGADWVLVRTFETPPASAGEPPRQEGGGLVPPVGGGGEVDGHGAHAARGGDAEVGGRVGKEGDLSAGADGEAPLGQG